MQIGLFINIVTASFSSSDNQLSIVTIKTDKGNIIIELYPECAPVTVENFVKLVESGFYDGITFHRYVKGFVIQGGDPDGTGTGGPGWTIPGEFQNPDLRKKNATTRKRCNCYGTQTRSGFCGKPILYLSQQ